MKYIFKTMIVVFLLIVSLIALWILFNVSVVPLGRLSENVTQENISSIKLGKNKCKVIEKLGAPLNSHKTYIMSKQGKIEPKSIIYTYSYSNPGILWDVEVYVHFDKDNKVTRINMQEGDNDFFIYDTQHPNKKINISIYNRLIPES